MELTRHPRPFDFLVLLQDEKELWLAGTMAGMTASQGQVATMDGGAKQSTNADFQAAGTYTKAALTATGGVCKGATNMGLIRGIGLNIDGT